MALPSAEALIAQVSDGNVDYAIVPSIDAAASRNIFLDYDVGFSVGAKRDLAWAVRAAAAEAARRARRVLRAGARATACSSAWPNATSPTRGRSSASMPACSRSGSRRVLPEYRSTFQRAQVATGVDWRLLAAIAYQESQWDPFATSETGVRGLMQITEDTAKHLGVADRLNPTAAVLGAARYVRDLKAKLPPRIAEPDRTWLALAAFNIGLAHLEDARVLAQKQKLNPDLWSDVKKVLPLLALPEYYEDSQVRLRARRHAGRVRRSRARVLRHPAAPGARLPAAPARIPVRDVAVTRALDESQLARASDWPPAARSPKMRA